MLDAPAVTQQSCQRQAVGRTLIIPLGGITMDDPRTPMNATALPCRRSGTIRTRVSSSGAVPLRHALTGIGLRGRRAFLSQANHEYCG